MRQAVVGGELDPLEVDEDHPDVVRGRFAEQARDQGVDHDALAGAGRAGDEQMRHLREVDRDRATRDIPSEGERQRTRGVEHLALLDEGPEPDDLAHLVRDLDPDGALARDRRLDPDRAGHQGHRQVVGQTLDPRHLDVDAGY